ASEAEFEARFPQNVYFRDGSRPQESWVRVRRDESLPNAWRRAGSAYVGILHWQHAQTIEADLSELEGGGLAPGTALRISPVQNRAQTIERVYTGAPVAIPMTGWTPAWPVGRDSGTPLPPTFPEL